MAEEKPRGRFVWFDLMTDDAAAASAFYTRVTGWGTSHWPGPRASTMWTVDSTPLGGVMTLAPDAGGPSHWLAYISSPDLDHTIQQAVDLGARVLVPATRVPTAGRFAVLSDPHGAVFASFTSDTSAPGHEGEARVGEFSWHELATHDYPAAFRFYQRLFGWDKLQVMDIGEAGAYQMFGRNGVVLGGMFNTSPHMPAPPGWLHYIRVDDVSRAVDAVTSGGGQVVNGPMEVPGGDWIAQCVDPQGAMFAVHARKK